MHRAPPILPNNCHTKNEKFTDSSTKFSTGYGSTGAPLVIRPTPSSRPDNFRSAKCALYAFIHKVSYVLGIEPKPK